MTELERLERVGNLREVWPTEDRHFTPWLEKNIGILGEALDIRLVVNSREESVGDHWADLVCTDTTEQSTVLIENQIAPADHTHIGQILTYAAGLKEDPVTVVWIAERFKDDHRAAIDWLNDITHDTVRFFALEIELWKINNSGPAPKFNIVSKPNDWSRGASEAGKPLSEARHEHYRFWNEFVEHVKQSDFPLRLRSPRHQHYMEFSLDIGGVRLQALRLNTDRVLRVQLVLSGRNRSAFFRALQDDMEDIESEFGHELEWELKSTRPSIDLTVGMVPTDQGDWHNQIDWFAEYLSKFDEVFRTRVHEIDPDEWQEPEEDPND